MERTSKSKIKVEDGFMRHTHYIGDSHFSDIILQYFQGVNCKMISYEPFWKTLREKEVSTYTLTKKLNVSTGTLHRMKQGGNISTHTINGLCKKLDCRVEDILIYIRDDESESPI